MGVVVGVQVPLAKGGVAIPVPLCLPFPLGGSFLHRLKREIGPPLIHRHTNISSTKAAFLRSWYFTGHRVNTDSKPYANGRQLQRTWTCLNRTRLTTESLPKQAKQHQCFLQIFPKNDLKSHYSKLLFRHLVSFRNNFYIWIFLKGVFETTLKGFLIILLFMFCGGKLSVNFSKKNN